MTGDDASRPPLDLDRLGRLDGPWRVEVVERLASTNAALGERARDGAEEGLVLVAEHQTSGRGRLDRSWETPPRAGLTFSVLLRPVVPDRGWPWLPLLAGLAVREGIVAAGGPACRLKWPNDLLHDELKLAGLLAERVETRQGPAVVLGVGINVSTLRDELPVATAGSLLLAGMSDPDRTRVLVEVLGALRTRYAAWAGGAGTSELHRDYLRSCETLGREVRVQLPGEQWLRGRAVDVDADGGLVVEEGGRRSSVSAGDVIHVRPGPAL